MTETTHEKIIIIDDEQRMCESLAALLSGDGYSVRTFQQSQDAIEVIKRERVDLVVTDIKMPFLSMVVFMIKWAIASIPALLILTLLFGLFSLIFNGFMGGMMQMGRF